MKANTKRDHELVARAIDGDTDAFKRLVLLYKDHSLSLICSILKDTVRSEDVLQNVFIKVYKNMNTFRFDASFSSWLYRIVVNASYNELKKQKNDLTIDTETIEMSIDHKNQMTEDDQKKFINLALKQIKPDEALVLRLYYLNELKIKEIQEVTGFGKSKIKIDLHRGRTNFHNKLKRILGKDIKHLL